MKKLVRAILLMLGVAASALFLWLGTTFFDFTLPEMLQVGAPTEAGEAAYRERMLSRFPVGSSQSDLLTGLTEMGFQINPKSERTSGSMQRLVRGGMLFCDRLFVVYWKGDADGQLTEVSPRYLAHCL